MSKKQEIYGLNEESWPYEYLINSLMFFSLSNENRENYFSTISNKYIDKYTKKKAVAIIISGFAENLPVGRTLDEWINDKNLENKEIEKDFYYFHKLGFMDNSDKILKNWELVRMQAIKILNKLGWSEVKVPYFSSEKILDSYEVHDAGNGWGWYWSE